MLSFVTPHQATSALGALKSIALVDRLSKEAVELIEVAAEALGVRVDVAALKPVEPEAAAQAFDDATLRGHLLHLQIVTAGIDGKITREELMALRRFEAAYGLRDPWIKNVQRVLEGKLFSLTVDLGRRMPSTRTLVETAGLRTVWHLMQFFFHLPPGDRERAWKFKQLGLLPEGTLGRTYWQNQTTGRRLFAGEVGGIPYGQWHHDILHLLTGYGMDDEGEMLICAFYAGWQYADRFVHRKNARYSKLFPDDPFALLFMPMCTYHLGLRLGIQGPIRGLFKPRPLLDAFRRGAASCADLNHSDQFWELLDLPIDAARERLKIAPGKTRLSDWANS